MTAAPDWWLQPRRICVVVDNPSWFLPFAEMLTDALQRDGDRPQICRHHDEIEDGAVAFYLSCVHLTPAHVLARNRRNLVVHESDLPEGRGFSPLTWQIIEDRKLIPVCLLEAIHGPADSGPVVYRDELSFEGHELIGELRQALGIKSIELCRRFLAEPVPPAGAPQQGRPSTYQRRRPIHSELDPQRTIADQFNLLRVADNKRYPAFFRWAGHRYLLRIEKASDLS